jgi:hypothetical protein
VELVICKTVTAKGRTVQDCEVRRGSSPFKFEGTGKMIAAELRRGGRTYAKGFELGSSRGRQIELALRPERKLARGRYTLVLKPKHRYRSETIMLG